MMVFSSTYEIYKQGTSQVITWLGKTAARCGYEAFAATSTAPPKKNSKKKASKSKQKGSIDSQGERLNHTISTKQLPALATFISEHFEDTADLKTLPRILEVLKDVI